MTYKQFILNHLTLIPAGCTCQDIVKAAHGVGIGTSYAAGSFSSILAKLRKDAIVVVAKRKGPKGGNIYILKEYT